MLRGARIVIADSHPLILTGLVALVEREGAVVAAACATAGQALHALQTQGADLVLLDMDTAGPGGAALLKTVCDAALPTRVVLTTSAPADARVFEAAAAAGAYCVCSKGDVDAVLHCLSLVAAGGRCHPAEPAPVPEPQREGAALGALTSRERAVAALVRDGCSNREIAEQLAISEGTVKVHLHNIFGKLGVTNRTALAMQPL